MKLLAGKAAVVTGSGRGIGRSVAMLLARHGAAVVVNDLDTSIVEEVLSEIRAEGGRAVGCVGSVTQKEFPDRLISTVLDNFGHLDVIVNNAGYTWDSVIHKMTDEQWYAIIDVHLTAPFRIIRAASCYLRETAKNEAAAGKRIHRKIINVSSISGITGNAGQANYAAAKMGIVGLTKTLAREWGRYNINVNAVAYGFIETRLVEAKEKGLQIDIEGRKIPIGIPKETMDAFKHAIPLVP